jgi:vanillate O-demethylase monooxygenase subunit
MYLRNAWYVAGWSADFPEGKLVARGLLDDVVVIYRKRDGGLVALRDRCAHRLAPLSLGRLEGDDLRCMYHGLKFAPSGQCVEIPGSPEKIPEAVRVKSFPVVERHSWVWVWPGDPALADESLIPMAIGLDDPDWVLRSGQLDYAANYRLINDNLLDFSHLSYVHPDSFGADEQWARKRAKVTPLERGVRVERWIENSIGFRGPPAIDHWSYYDFLVPGILLLGSKIYPAGTAASLNGEAPTGMPLSQTFSCQAVTPLTETTSRYFFSWGPRNGPGAEAVADMLLKVAHQAFGEDKAIIEAQQKVIARSADVNPMPTPADRAVIAFQRILNRLMQAEATHAS